MLFFLWQRNQRRGALLSFTFTGPQKLVQAGKSGGKSALNHIAEGEFLDSIDVLQSVESD